MIKYYLKKIQYMSCREVSIKIVNKIFSIIKNIVEKKKKKRKRFVFVFCFGGLTPQNRFWI